MNNFDNSEIAEIISHAVQQNNIEHLSLMKNAGTLLGLKHVCEWNCFKANNTYNYILSDSGILLARHIRELPINVNEVRGLYLGIWNKRPALSYHALIGDILSEQFVGLQYFYVRFSHVQILKFVTSLQHIKELYLDIQDVPEDSVYPLVSRFTDTSITCVTISETNLTVVNANNMITCTALSSCRNAIKVIELCRCTITEERNIQCLAKVCMKDSDSPMTL